jgi:capsular exopolysaccharide synthesis family protein
MIAELRTLVLKYRALLVTTCLLGLALGLVMARRQRPTFVAVGMIQIPGGPLQRSEFGGVSNHAPSPGFLSEALTIKDDRTLNRVISELHLAENATFLRIKPPGDPDPAQRAELRETALRRLRADLQVDAVREANLLRLSIKSRDPRLAIDIVNNVIDDFAESRYKLRYEASQQASHFMAPRLEALEAQVKQEQTNLLLLQKQLDLPGFNPRRNQLDIARDHLVDEQVRAHLIHIATEIRLNLLKLGAENLASAPSLVDLPAQVTASQPASESPTQPALEGFSTSTSLRLSIAAAEEEAALLSATLGAEHPQLQAVRARVEALQASLETERRSLLSAAAAEDRLAVLREHQLTEELERRNQRNAELAPAVLQYDTEQRDFLFSRALFLRFLWKLHLAAIDRAYDGADVSVVDRASIHVATPIEPFWEFGLRYAIYGLIAGTLIIVRFELHFGTARQRLDDLEDVTGLKLLGIIPKTERLSVRSLIAPLNTDLGTGSGPKRPQAAYLQSVFDLRALIQAPFGRTAEPRTILFTSAVPSEGKTTLSSSVAAVMARKDRVLLIDADLRRPSVQRVFRLPGRIGLSSILNGKSTLAEAVLHVPNAPNLDLLGSGPIPPVATALIESPQMRQLLVEAAATYDFVIIDSPPVLAVTDCLLITQMVDAVVWIVKDTKVGRQGLIRARSLLENAGAPVIGLAVNAMQIKPLKLSKLTFGWRTEFLERFRRA